MADLEDGGYLRQPHTSAGRIPSDKGYRFYVDVLIEPAQVGIREQAAFKNVFRKTRKLEKLMEQAARLLSELTQYTAVILVPKRKNATFMQIQFVLLAPGHVLTILVTEPGFVDHEIFQLEDELTQEELSSVAAWLNEHLAGVRLADFHGKLIEGLPLTGNKALKESIGELIYLSLISTGEQVMLEGAMGILKQPEFCDLERARPILELLQKQEFVSTLLRNFSRPNEVAVVIGPEMHLPVMAQCSIVAASYQLGLGAMGAIGVIGPTRMDYVRVISLVNFLKTDLEKTLRNITAWEAEG
jgi:heat-inducible transcriptional repressor